MSHIVHIETQVRDPAAVAAACQRLRLPAPEPGSFALFNSEAAGLAVRLAGWTYPVVCQTDTGQVAFDNFEGAWGDRQRLDEFLQAYAVEKVRLEARRQGRSVMERPLADGSIKLTVCVGEA